MERFNQQVEGGKDEDFHRGESHWTRMHTGSPSTANPNLGTVKEPPFYGGSVSTNSFSSVGVLTNHFGQVVTWRQEVIDGLYSVGDAAAHTEFGVGYQGGLNLGSGLEFAYRAVQDMRQWASH